MKKERDVAQQEQEVLVKVHDSYMKHQRSNPMFTHLDRRFYTIHNILLMNVVIRF